MIQYGRQNIDASDIDAVVAALESDFLTTGTRVRDFEETLADYSGVKYAVACSNGTAALHLAYLAAGIGPGDEIITSPLTFAATGNAALYCGAKPVFVDVDAVTWQMDATLIEAAITERTKAIVPVHYMGAAGDLVKIREIADKHGLMVISDGAHAVGTQYLNQHIATYSDMTTFSFHPVKNITTGEGGAILTDDRDLQSTLKDLSSHGIVRNPEDMNLRGPWVYDQHILGYNYRITDLQCALGASQLRRIEAFRSKRNEIILAYDEAFTELDYVKLPEVHKGVFRHIYVIKLMGRLSDKRRQVFEWLRGEGIGVNVHYIPIYYHSYYKALGYEKGLCPIAESTYESIITLPLHTKMSDADVETVIEAIRKIGKIEF